MQPYKYLVQPIDDTNQYGYHNLDVLISDILQQRTNVKQVMQLVTTPMKDFYCQVTVEELVQQYEKEYL